MGSEVDRRCIASVSKEKKYVRTSVRARTRCDRNNNGNSLDEWEDIFYGEAYLNAVGSGKIKPEDMVLLMSIDGAQLYQSKQSDCWI
ncbi:hypothetical protein BDZ97DRAFT_1663604, partial [Flammula alnicola]